MSKDEQKEWIIKPLLGGSNSKPFPSACGFRDFPKNQNYIENKNEIMYNIIVKRNNT